MSSPSILLQNLNICIANNPDAVTEEILRYKTNLENGNINPAPEDRTVVVKFLYHRNYTIPTNPIPL